jgi:hypothetical protein
MTPSASAIFKRDLIDSLRETPVVDQRRDLAFAQASRQEITSLSKHLQPQRHINAGPAQHQNAKSRRFHSDPDFDPRRIGRKFVGPAVLD